MSPADIQRYLADCARGTNNFKEGSGLTYPQRMDLEVNKTEIYKVTINLSGEGQPELIPNGEVGTVPITLQCQVKASLVSSDPDSLDVPASGDGVRNFYPTGQVEWTWQVTAKKPGQHELQLRLEPALVAGQTVFDADPATQRRTVVTKVNATGDFWQNLRFWSAENWGPIAAGAVAIGGAIVGLVTWYGSLGEAWNKSRRGWRRNQSSSDRNASPSRQQDHQEEERSGYM